MRNPAENLFALARDAQSLPAYAGRDIDFITSDLRSVLSSQGFDENGPIANKNIAALSKDFAMLPGYAGRDAEFVKQDLAGLMGKFPTGTGLPKYGVAQPETLAPGTSNVVEPMAPVAAAAPAPVHLAPAAPVTLPEVPVPLTPEIAGFTPKFSTASAGTTSTPAMAPVALPENAPARALGATTQTPEQAALASTLSNEIKSGRRIPTNDNEVRAMAGEFLHSITYGAPDALSEERLKDFPAATVTGQMAGIIGPVFAGGIGAAKAMTAIPAMVKLAESGAKLKSGVTLGRVAYNAIAQMTAQAADYSIRNKDALLSEDPKIRNQALAGLAVNTAAIGASSAPAALLKPGWFQPIVGALVDGVTNIGATKTLGQDPFAPEVLPYTLANIAAGGLFRIPDMVPGKPAPAPDAPPLVKGEPVAPDALAPKQPESVAPKALAPKQPTAPDALPQGAKGAPAERRQDTARRKAIDEMTPEEAKEALRTDELTGLKTRRAWDDTPRQPVQAIFDVDGLKWFNDNLGYEAGDQLLKETSAALKAAGIDAYRMGGASDETRAQGVDPKVIAKQMEIVYTLLKDKTIEGVMPDGTPVIVKGLGVSYGLHTAKSTSPEHIAEAQRFATERLHEHKTLREQQGARGARGEEPPGVSKLGSQGIENQDLLAPKPGSTDQVVSAKATAEPVAKQTPVEPEAAGKPPTEPEAPAIAEPPAPPKPPKTPADELFPQQERPDPEQGGASLKTTGNTVGGDKSFKRKAKTFINYWFRSGGNKPDEIVAADKRRLGRIAEQEAMLEDNMADFKVAAKTAYGKEPSAQDYFKLDKVLKGEADFSTIPEPMWKPLKALKAQKNILSQQIKDSGLLNEKGMKTFDVENWVNRSYRIHGEKGYADKVPQETIDAAKGYIKKTVAAEGKEISEAELQGEVDALLFKQESPEDVIPAVGKIGSVVRGILEKRKDIPVEFRALLGEWQRADVNATRSITKASHMLANHEYLKEIVDSGADKFFFTKPQVKDGVSYSTEIASAGSKTLEPLAGRYTSKEIAREIEDSFSGRNLDLLARTYMKAIAVTKLNKTVLNPSGQVRNLTGNILIHIANGDFSPSSMATSFKGVLGDFTKRSTAEQRAEIVRLKKLGLIGDSANAGELRDVIRDASVTDMDAMVGSGITKAGRQGIKFAEKLYGYGDDFWKIAGFLSKKKQYQKADPSITDEQIVQMVRDQYPTYSEISRIVRGIRRLPIVGTFPSFSAEIIRTTYNQFKQMHKDMSSSNPKIKALGIKHAASIVAATALPGMIGTGIGLATGSLMDPKKKNALRELLPTWSDNSELITLPKTKEGKYPYVDVGYTDPYAYLKKPLNALVRGDDWEKAYWMSIGELTAPFLSEDILTSKVLDVARNRKIGGGIIYNPADKVDMAIKIFQHFLEGVEPGFITNFRRIGKAYTGERTATGQSENIGKELASMTTGLRISEADPEKALVFAARRFNSDKQDLTAMYRRKQQEPDFSGISKSLKRKITAAKTLGLTEEQVTASLREGGISEIAKAFIVTNMNERIVESLKDAGPDLKNARAQWQALKDEGYKVKYGEFLSKYKTIAINNVGDENIQRLAATKNEKEKAELVEKIVAEKDGLSPKEKQALRRRLVRSKNAIYQLLTVPSAEE